MKKRGKTIFRTYFMLFFLISAMPVFISGILYYFLNISSMEAKIEASRVSSMEFFKQKMDYLYVNCSNIAAEYSANPVVSAFMTGETVQPSRELTSLLRLKQQIFDNRVKNMLYKNGDKGILTSDGFVDYGVFSTSTGMEMNLVMAQFFLALNRSVAPSLVANGVFPEGNPSGSSGGLSFVFPVPFNTTYRNGAVAFMCRDDYVQEIFENCMGSLKAELFIFDRYSQPAYYLNSTGIKNPAQPEAVLVSKLAGLRGVGKFDLDRQIALRTLLDINNLSVCVVMQKDEFYKDVNTAKAVFVSVISALALFSACTAALFSLKIYRPVKTLISNIKPDEGETTDSSYVDEFELLETVYTDTLESKKQLMSIMDRQLPILRERCILVFLNNSNLTEDEAAFYKQSANINFPYNGFFAAVVGVPQSSKNEVFSTVVNALAGFVFDGAVGYGVEILRENSIGLIINAQMPDAGSVGTADTTDVVDMRYAICSKILDYAGYDNAFMIGAGMVYDSAVRLSESYIEATVALQLKLATEHDRVAVYTHFDSGDNNMHGYIHDTDVSLIIQGILHGNVKIATDAFTRFLDGVSKSGDTFVFVRYACFHLIESVAQVCLQSKLPFDKKNIEVMGQFKTLAEFKNTMQSAIVQICALMSAKKEQETSSLRQNIIEFINNAYTDYNLSLELVAGQFNISTSYLRNLIKQETGCSFNAYVTFLRMEEAKRLLRDTDEKIKDIVTAVGYADPANFIRKFKGYELMTPGEYRQGHCHFK